MPATTTTTKKPTTQVTPKKTVTNTKKTPKETPTVLGVVTEKVTSPLEYNRMVAEAAFYIAEKRGFAPGNEYNDWVEAERQVQSKLVAG